MLRNQSGVAVATQTKIGTAMKTLLAVTVAVAAISAISAFGLVAGSGLQGLLTSGLTVRVSSDTPQARDITGPGEVDILHLDLTKTGSSPFIIKGATFTIQTQVPAEAFTGFNLYQADGVRLAGPVMMNASSKKVVFAINVLVPVSSRVYLKAIVNPQAGSGAFAATINPASDIVIMRTSSKTTIQPNAVLAGRVMTLVSGSGVGSLKVEVSPDRAVAAQLVAGSTGSSIMSYKLSALGEDIEVSQFKVATRGSNAGQNINAIKVYLNGVQIGLPVGYVLDPSNGIAQVTLAPGTLVVPQDGNVILAFKIDLANKTQLVDASTLELGLGTGTAGDGSQWGANGAYAAGYYNMTATGQESSGVIAKNTINNTGLVGGRVAGSFKQYLYDGILIVRLSPGSPSGMAIAQPSIEVLRLDLTAVGDDITITDLEFKKLGTCVSTGVGAAYLKSQDLSTTYATWASGTAWFNVANFSMLADAIRDSELIISAGATKTVELIGDTSTCMVPNQTLQIRLGSVADTASGAKWQNASGNSVDSTLTKNLPVDGRTLVY